MSAEELTIKLKRLLEELKDNQKTAHQHQAGGRGKLVTLAWDAVKDKIDDLGENLSLTLRMAYGEVWRFNAFRRAVFNGPLVISNEGIFGTYRARAVCLFRHKSD